jgi:hypothetical protein
MSRLLFAEELTIELYVGSGHLLISFFFSVHFNIVLPIPPFSSEVSLINIILRGNVALGKLNVAKPFKRISCWAFPTLVIWEIHLESYRFIK